MSDSTAVVVPTNTSGSLQPAQAAAVTTMKGGAIAVTAMPLSGGGKRKKTKKVPKKILKLFKKGSAGKLRKLMKGGEAAKEVVVGGEGEGADLEGARRRRRTRRHSRRHSRRGHSFLY